MSKEIENVWEYQTDICADNGRFYCRYLLAAKKLCGKFKKELFFEDDPNPLSALSFIEKCEECKKITSKSS